MRYLIDGYNLVHAMGLLSPKKGVDRALENARFDLLNRLHGHFGDQSGQITVIFDAERVPRRGQPVHDYRGLHVQFAVRQEADEWIETLIRNEPTPKNLTVVSDDHRVQVAARRRQCPVLGCQAFLDLAEREPRPDPAKAGDAHGKPEDVAPEERQHWLNEFADLDDDPALKNWLDPGFFEVEE